MSQSFSNELALRYAKALFELALEGKQLDAIEADVKQLEELLALSADTTRMIHNPLLSRKIQETAIAAILKHLGISTLTTQFCQLLAANRRLPLLPLILSTFLTLLSEHRGQVTAEVTAAVALRENQVVAIRGSLKEALKHDIRLNVKEDAEILGGLVIKIGSKMLDGSLKNKLERLRMLSTQAIAANN